MDKADDENMKDLLKSYGAIETHNRDKTDAVVTGMYGNIAGFLYKCILVLREKKSSDLCKLFLNWE